MENAKTRITIEQSDGLKKEFLCDGYAAMMFDGAEVTAEGTEEEKNAIVIADECSLRQIAMTVMCEGNPFHEAHEMLNRFKEIKLPWRLRRKLKKTLDAMKAEE